MTKMREEVIGRATLSDMAEALLEVRALVRGANHSATRYPKANAALNHIEDILGMVSAQGGAKHEG